MMKRFSVCAVMALMAVLWGCEKKPVLVETVSLSETTLTLVEGETKVLTAEIAPADAENQSVTWSTSDKSVVTVEDGTVTAIKAGEATVTATANDKGSVKAECKVTVTAAKVAVTGVSLDKTTLTVAAGGNAKLTATVAPANATNKRVTWSSSDEAIATVDSEGKVTANAAGTATITVTTKDGNKTAECKVTVGIPVTGVSLDKTTLTVAAGGNAKLTATVAPANATNKSVTWSSSNQAIATVDSEGNVTVKSAGTATITVTTKDGGKTATCTVTVTAAKVAVTGVSLNHTSLTVAAGGNAKLTATVAPTNATNKSVTWSSSDEAIATVDSEGNVTVKSAGTATITVTTKDGGKTATCTVTVGIPVTGVSLKWTSLTLTKGKSAKLKAKVAPANATNKNVTWSSSDGAIATVDSEGNVTANAAGTATITVTTADGNKTTECTVTVTEIDAIVGGWNVTSSEMKTRIGKNKWKSERALIYKSFTFTNKAAAGELGWREVGYDVRNVKVHGKYKEQGDKIEIKPNATGSDPFTLTEVIIEDGTKLHCTIIVNKAGTAKLLLEMEKATIL